MTSSSTADAEPPPAATRSTRSTTSSTRRAAATTCAPAAGEREHQVVPDPARSTGDQRDLIVSENDTSTSATLRGRCQRRVRPGGDVSAPRQPAGPPLPHDRPHDRGRQASPRPSATPRRSQGVDLAVPRGTRARRPRPQRRRQDHRRAHPRHPAPPGRAAPPASRGHDVLRHPERVRRPIGLTGQYASVDEDLTGRQNLVLFGPLLDLPSRRRPRPRGRAARLVRPRPTPPTAPPRPTPAACAGGWTSPRASSAAPR